VLTTGSIRADGRFAERPIIDGCAINEPLCMHFPAETGLALGTLPIIGSAAVYNLAI
jgi:hypothetical protein